MNFLRNTPANEDKDLRSISHLHHTYSLDEPLHSLLALQSLLEILLIHTCEDCLGKIIFRILPLTSEDKIHR